MQLVLPRSEQRKKQIGMELRRLKFGCVNICYGSRGSNSKPTKTYKNQSILRFSSVRTQQRFRNIANPNKEEVKRSNLFNVTGI